MANIDPNYNNSVSYYADNPGIQIQAQAPDFLEAFDPDVFEEPAPDLDPSPPASPHLHPVPPPVLDFPALMLDAPPEEAPLNMPPSISSCRNPHRRQM
jgi:hypothetical protein